MSPLAFRSTRRMARARRVRAWARLGLDLGACRARSLQVVKRRLIARGRGDRSSSRRPGEVVRDFGSRSTRRWQRQETPRSGCSPRLRLLAPRRGGPEGPPADPFGKDFEGLGPTCVDDTRKRRGPRRRMEDSARCGGARVPVRPPATREPSGASRAAACRILNLPIAEAVQLFGALELTDRDSISPDAS